MVAVLILVLRILLLLVLFAFLGWTMFTLWRELNFQAQSLLPRKNPTITIIQESESQEIRQEFNQSELMIGRDPACEIQLNDETVSNQHARLWFRNKQWWIEDLLSTNGTFLNDERLEIPTILISGDEVRIGKVLLTIDIESQP